MFGHSMFGVFEVQYFGVRSKTSMYTHDLLHYFSILAHCEYLHSTDTGAVKVIKKSNSCVQ